MSQSVKTKVTFTMADSNELQILADEEQAQDDWGQVRPKWDHKIRGLQMPASGTTNGTTTSSSTNHGPPFLPPQLLKSLLNKEVDEHYDPNMLPEPASHVMLNHLYAQSVKDNVLVMASEIGVYDVEPGDVFQKGRLRPGRMLLVDMENKTVIRDEEMKRTISESRPHGKWWREHLTLRDFVS